MPRTSYPFSQQPGEAVRQEQIRAVCYASWKEVFKFFDHSIFCDAERQCMQVQVHTLLLGTEERAEDSIKCGVHRHTYACAHLNG